MTVEGSKELGRPGVRLIGVLVLAIAVALTGISAFGPGAADAKFKQAGCAKFKKKIKKAKGKAKKQKAKRQFKQCKANRKVYNQVKDSRFVGTRASGFGVDIILCANGLFIDDPGTPFETVYRKGWRISDARVKGKNIQGAYEALISRKNGQLAARTGSLVRKKGKWQAGSESFGRPDDLGDATRTSAKKECRKF